MTIEIRGLRYFTASEVAEEVGVSRQTLWRWRQEGSIPQGHRFRKKHVIFTPAELRQIDEFANRIEPIESSEKNQRDLFGDR